MPVTRFVRSRSLTMFTVMSLTAVVPGCGGPVPLSVEMPLHLEEHLDAATIVGSEVPEHLPQPIVWDFSEPQPDWKAPEHYNPTIPALTLERLDDALRIRFDERHADPRSPVLHGDFYVDLPDLNREEWSHVLIRARSSEGIRRFLIGFNTNPRATADDPDLGMFQAYGDRAPVVNDGTVQTYRLRADWHETSRFDWEGPWRQLVLSINAGSPSSIDILSITLVPKATVYGEAPAGVREIRVGRQHRRALYTHAPGRVEYQVRVPEGGRLDVGLGVFREDVPVTFRVEVAPSGAAPVTLLEERYADKDSWGQRSIDLAAYARRKVTLALETDAAETGTVAFWGAPTVSGSPRVAAKPNVIFYVIDGAGAEYMSLYGYNRRTTPNLERLAAEAAVFQWAYSNSSWTRPSTASFMTSLQHSVMGGARGGFNVVPEDVPTMAQHLHWAGYQTAVFTANPNAGRMSGLEREVDFFKEDWEEFSYSRGSGSYEESSRYLHDAFWDWREAYPAEPYWVHFQTVDIHGNFPAAEPFSGLFVDPGQLEMMEDWRMRLRQVGSGDIYSDAWGRAGVSRVMFWAVRQGLYDETMAYNDHQIGRLVERLKATGEWENTLFIVAADHSIRAAIGDVGVAIRDTLPPHWHVRDERPYSSPLLRPSVSRIPLLFVWPGHIKGGQRFDKSVVSMVDVLPTVLDLVGLPVPDVVQGQSLAPLLLGEEGWEPRPVILDEFYADPETGELRGFIEVIDGRWGASLEINPYPHLPPEQQRPVPLLLYDLWNDPQCLHSLHQEHPDLVEEYTAFLEAQFEAHLALSKYFTPGESVDLTPEQLETLRALGYIQ